MLFDTHLHTKFSADSKMSIEDAILSAKQQNIGLVLTEHLDYDFIVMISMSLTPNNIFKNILATNQKHSI